MEEVTKVGKKYFGAHLKRLVLSTQEVGGVKAASTQLYPPCKKKKKNPEKGPEDQRGQKLGCAPL